MSIFIWKIEESEEREAQEKVAEVLESDPSLVVYSIACVFLLICKKKTVGGLGELKGMYTFSNLTPRVTKYSVGPGVQSEDADEILKF